MSIINFGAGPAKLPEEVRLPLFYFFVNRSVVYNFFFVIQGPF